MKKRLSRIIAIMLVLLMVICNQSYASMASDTDNSISGEAKTLSGENEAGCTEIATDSDAVIEVNNAVISEEDKNTDTEEDTEANDNSDEEINSDMKDIADESEVSEEGEDEKTYPLFVRSCSVDGIRVTVTASEGAFPEGATLSVNKVTDSEKEQINQAVEAVRDDSVSVAEAYTFDIKVLDENGTELQPANGQTVNVSFAMDEVSNQNLSTDIYHIPEENGSLVAEELSTSESGNTVTAVSDGFSYYTVEFTYNEKQYVMEGDSSVALTDILSYVGITKADGSAATDSDITAVSVSDESLFSASKESGEWIVTAHQAFTSNEWMKVTVDGVEYEIVVTDAIYRTTTNYTAQGWDDAYFVYDGVASYTINGGGVVSMSPDRSSGTNSWNAAIAADGTLTYNGTSYGKLSSGKNAWHLYWDSNASSAWSFAGSLVWAQAYVAPPNWTVTYDKNSGSDDVSGLSSTTVTVDQGSSTTLPTLTRSGYTFNGWYTAASGGNKAGNGGASYTPTGNITLYAQWTLTPATAPTINSVRGATLTYGYTANSGSVSISASPASGHTITGYQWYSNTSNSNSGGSEISGATGTSYTIPAGMNAGNYYYYCVVSTKREDNDQTTTKASDVATVKVNKAEISITAKEQTKTYGSSIDTDIEQVTVTGLITGDSLDSITLTPSTSDATTNGTIIPSAATIKKSGTNVTNNYSITYNTGALKINKKTITIASGITASDKTYDGTTNATLSTEGINWTSCGMISGDSLSVTAIGTFDNKNVGNGKTVSISNLSLSGASAGNYQLATSGQQTSTTADITAKSLKITADAKSKTYGEDDPALTYTSNGLVEGDSITGSLSRVSGENIGTYAIQQGALSAGSNYTITYTGENLTISKKALNITADEKSKVYGSEDPALTYTVSGLVNSDTEDVVTGSLVRETGENVGSYAINQGTLYAGDNYTINYTSKNLSITQKEVNLIWGDTSFTYNGSQQVPTATISGVINDDDCTVSVNGAKTDYSASPYTATAVLDGAKKDNYMLPAEKTKQFTISKKAATITANDQIVTYGTSIASDTAHVTTEGFVDGEALTAITLTPSTSDVTTDGTITPSAAVIKNGDTDVTNNYNITYNTGSLTINKKPITISGITASNKTYDGTTAATLNYSGINWADCGKVGDDDLSVTATGVFSDANIGAGKTVIISDLTLSGAKADNYELASSGQQTDTTANITAKSITITADSDSKVYDGTTHTKNSYSVTSGVLADGDTIESVTVTGSQKYAGSSANVPSDAVIKNSSGVDVTSNYNITYTNGTIEVTKKPLTITADSDTKVYDTTPLTKNSYTHTALAEGDTIESVTVTGTQTAVGESANVPSAAVIKNGDENVIANYDITYVNGTLKVTKKAVTITADDDTKVYDGTPLTKDSYTVSGLESGDRIDSVTITGSQIFAGTSNNVPSEAVIKNSANEDVNDNYTISYVNGTLEVTPKAVTITADSDIKEYDGTALTKDSYTKSELATGDTIESVTVTGSQTAAGEGANVPSAAVIKNASNEDVTSSYNITYVNGTLEVTKKAVTITADSNSKVYDKTALTKDSYTNSDLASGDSIESVIITGSQTDAGESANVPSAAVIKNATDEDVTASYDITYVNGNLEVTKKPITISGITVIDKIYDGTTDAELDYSDIDWTACGMVDGDELSVTAKGTYEDTSVGEDKSVTITDITIGGTSVDNYILAEVGQQTQAVAKITKKSVTVTALKQTVAVNGEIENTIEYAELSGAVEGHKLAEITLTSGSTEKTTTEGVITPSEAKIVDGDIDVTDNYDITYADGVMTVTKAEAEVVLDNGDDEAPASVTAVEVPNLLELADEEAEEGKLVKVELSVKPVSENKVNAVTVSDVKKTVESLFAFVDKESVKVEYLEIDLTKYIDNVKDGAISDTGTPLEIILTYDNSKAGNPVIIRSHEGTVKVFTQLSVRPAGSLTDATYYVEGNKIYMYSQYFSDFAIAYSVEKTFNVNLDDGNGNIIRQIVSEGAKFIPPADLAKDGYDFGGWYKDEAFTQKWNPDTDKVTSDIKLYAKWAKKAEPTKADTPETKVDTPKAATTPTNTAKSPTTGDTSHADIVFFLMILAVLGMICLRFIRKKNLR